MILEGSNMDTDLPTFLRPLLSRTVCHLLNFYWRLDAESSATIRSSASNSMRHGTSLHRLTASLTALLIAMMNGSLRHPVLLFLLLHTFIWSHVGYYLLRNFFRSQAPVHHLPWYSFKSLSQVHEGPVSLVVAFKNLFLYLYQYENAPVVLILSYNCMAIFSSLIPCSTHIPTHRLFIRILLQFHSFRSSGRFLIVNKLFRMNSQSIFPSVFSISGVV